MKSFSFAIFFLSSMFCFSQQLPNIIPAPVKMEMRKGTFALSPLTVIVINNDAEKPSADFLNSYLKKFFGFELVIATEANTSYIKLETPVFVRAPDKPERYTVSVDSNSIQIQGDSHVGTFYGIQTLIQLLPVQKDSLLFIPQLYIEDYPRFAYRGLHLDVGRHFFPVEFIKKYIDFIALHKMNTFHWHLTEDQGWRIEIKQYPKLTEIGSCRDGTIIGRYPGTGNDSIKYCGYYTQNEIREIVKYAAQRYITVIPEIEMPGHSSAAIASYPQLSCFPNEPTKIPARVIWSGTVDGKEVQQAWGVFEDVYCPGEGTFQFLQDVLDEVMELFPSEYIHIGGDECPKINWKRSSYCKQLIKQNGLKDEHELQSYFIQHIEKYLNSKGRKIIGWDEILEGGLAPNATVMSWRGEKGGVAAAQQNHNVIMTPGNWCYFDYAQSKNEDSVTIGSYTPVEEVYSYEPVPQQLSAEQTKHILGAQANVWTEYMKNTRKVEHMIFPRLSAMSEVLWSPKENRNWEDFKNRLQTQFKRYDLWQVNYNTKGINNGE